MAQSLTSGGCEHAPQRRHTRGNSRAAFVRCLRSKDVNLAATFRRRRFRCKKQGFLNVANVDFQNARFATLSRHFRVSLQFLARKQDFTL